MRGGGSDVDVARLFISFAIEDRALRDLLKGQSLNTSTPFSFTDMSVKEPWDSAWKTNCRSRIKGCDGVIGIITSNTPKADGQLWELKCAYEENVPVLLIYGDDSRPAYTPSVISDKRIFAWSWDTIANFIDRI